VYNKINPIGNLIPNFLLNFFLSLPNLLFLPLSFSLLFPLPPSSYTTGFSKVPDILWKHKRVCLTAAHLVLPEAANNLTSYMVNLPVFDITESPFRDN
jgi:hypothetical protein